MNQKITIDCETLYFLYAQENKTLEECSEILGVSRSVVKRNILECGIYFRGNNKPRIVEDLLRDMYSKRKMSIRKIAEVLGVNPNMVRASMKEYGIRPRKRYWEAKTRRNGEYVPCNTCGTEVYRKKYLLERYDVFFCSWKCEKEYQSVTRSVSELPEAWRRRRGYKKWRKAVLERDRYACSICGSEDKIIAHHIVEAQHSPDIRLDVDNGIALCQECHIEVHRIGSTNYIESLKEAIS